VFVQTVGPYVNALWTGRQQKEQKTYLEAHIRVRKKNYTSSSFTIISNL